MKKVLNHEDKENRNVANLPKQGHPSQESRPKPFKPTIKYLVCYAESDISWSLRRRSSASIRSLS
jgi:hypothetical protein